MNVSLNSYASIDNRMCSSFPIFKGNSNNLLFEGKKLLINDLKSEKKYFNITDFIRKFCNKFKRQENIPEVKEALLAFFNGLQTEKEFFKELAEKKVNGDYIMSNQQNIANIITRLENKGVIKGEAPWESPRFYNGVLRDDAYKNIRESVEAAPSYKLSNIEKKDILNSLAKNNYHNEDIIYDFTFKGQDESSDIPDVNDDADESILDDILDFLDDLF